MSFHLALFLAKRSAELEKVEGLERRYRWVNDFAARIRILIIRDSDLQGNSYN